MIARDFAQEIGGRRGLAVGHAGDRLVDQQELRVLRQQHADFQPLLLPVRQRSGDARPMVGKPRRREDGVDRLPRLRVFASEQSRAHAARRLGRQQEIVLDRVIFEHGRLLELAPDPERRDLGFVELGQIMAPVEHHLAFVGARLAGDDVHHRRLARAVGADDRPHLARLEHQRQAAQRLIAVERYADAVEIEERLREGRIGRLGQSHGSAPSSTASTETTSRGFGSLPLSARPSRPLGRNNVTRTNMRPRP